MTRNKGLKRGAKAPYYPNVALSAASEAVPLQKRFIEIASR
jgi:hypothetical protein